MKLRHIIASVVLSGLMVGCNDLDIEPKNILSGSAVYNESGITAFMAALYGRLPMEDFNMTTDGGGKQGFFGWNCIAWDMTATGETVNGNVEGMVAGDLQRGYWSEAYQIIRQANTLIQDLPSYEGSIPGVPEWIAEARFIRAYTYFALVKRYGGMPLITEPQVLGSDDSSLWVARSSHKESVDFILEDLDYAMEHMTTEKVAGRANRYVAAAFKSRVALYAGSVARYGGLYDYTAEDGVQVMGIPADAANDYFQQAYDAAVATDAGGYSLYEGDADKAVNFRNIFEKADNSPESIFIRQYNINNNVHSFDAVYCPERMTSTYGARYNVTLDWVELFDGLPLDPATGYLKTTDDNGNYIVYNDEKELFKNAEPRLKGSIMMPGETYKGIELDIRSGIIKESVDPSTPIAKFVKDDGQTTTAWNQADNAAWFNANVLTTTGNMQSQTDQVVISTGEKLNRNGQDGPTNSGGSPRGTRTGFHGLKWINTSWSKAETQLHVGVQSWIDIRYAEVLLNRAEAALELAQHGVTSYAGKDMNAEALDCLNKVRSRAGATLATAADLTSEEIVNERGTGINSFVFAPTKGLRAIRVERYKELAFEHKVFWDLRRWFTFDEQIKNYRRRMLAPFLFAKGAKLDAAGNPTGKYIYDTRCCMWGAGNITFASRYYYDRIPDSERKINPLLMQNNQY